MEDLFPFRLATVLGLYSSLSGYRQNIVLQKMQKSWAKIMTVIRMEQIQPITHLVWMEKLPDSNCIMEISMRITTAVTSVMMLMILEILFLKGRALQMKRANRKLQTVRIGRTNRGQLLRRGMQIPQRIFRRYRSRMRLIPKELVFSIPLQKHFRFQMSFPFLILLRCLQSLVPTKIGKAMYTRTQTKIRTKDPILRQYSCRSNVCETEKMMMLRMVTKKKSLVQCHLYLSNPLQTSFLKFQYCERVSDFWITKQLILRMRYASKQMMKTMRMCPEDLRKFTSQDQEQQGGGDTWRISGILKRLGKKQRLRFRSPLMNSLKLGGYWMSRQIRKQKSWGKSQRMQMSDRRLMARNPTEMIRMIHPKLWEIWKNIQDVYFCSYVQIVKKWAIPVAVGVWRGRLVLEDFRQQAGSRKEMFWFPLQSQRMFGEEVREQEILLEVRSSLFDIRAQARMQVVFVMAQSQLTLWLKTSSTNSSELLMQVIIFDPSKGCVNPQNPQHTSLKEAQYPSGHLPRQVLFSKNVYLPNSHSEEQVNIDVSRQQLLGQSFSITQASPFMLQSPLGQEGPSIQVVLRQRRQPPRQLEQTTEEEQVTHGKGQFTHTEVCRQVLLGHWELHVLLQRRSPSMHFKQLVEDCQQVRQGS